MKHPSWDRIEEIYHAAAALPPSEREAFVAKACEQDPVLIREVNELLAARDSSDDFLKTPIVTLGVDDLVGTKIDGRYVIESELGGGGMSQVYLAYDSNLEQKVVIKILSRDLLEDASARQKFRQEVEALKRIRHDNVVRVLDKGELREGRPYIVMEHVDGETLRSEIPPEGMNLHRAAAILKQIGAALEHIHQNNVFHRDLKPTNIMIRRDTDSVVLVDFGIAKVKQSAVAPSTIDGSVFGTLGYVSHEQLRGEAVTAASDIYSMAVVAYEMVTGRLPFNPASPADLIEMQRAGVRAKPRDLRPNISLKAQDIILRGLKFKSGSRYKNAREFGDDLGEALLDTRIVEPKRWPRALIITLGLALLSSGIYWYINKFEKPRNRSFKYWLTVQPMHEGKEYEAPFRSHGEDEKFDNGDKFKLSIQSTVPAYFYVFNESPVAQNDTNFRMVFPTPTINSGLATLGANQTFQSDWFTFEGPEGDDNFWIVWSVSPVPELESAKNEAFKHPKGGLTGQNAMTVKEFLRRKQLEVKVTVYNYGDNQTAVARGPADLLVTLAQFKHR